MGRISPIELSLRESKGIFVRENTAWNVRLSDLTTQKTIKTLRKNMYMSIKYARCVGRNTPDVDSIYAVHGLFVDEEVLSEKEYLM